MPWCTDKTQEEKEKEKEEKTSNIVRREIVGLWN
jgi:hypothetical protein